jgi:hypothetical protein
MTVVCGIDIPADVLDDARVALDELAALTPRVLDVIGRAKAAQIRLELALMAGSSLADLSSEVEERYGQESGAYRLSDAVNVIEQAAAAGLLDHPQLGAEFSRVKAAWFAADRVA